MAGLSQCLRFAFHRSIGKGAALAMGFVLLSGAVAVASIPDSSGVINGCFNRVNGNLRVIDTATDSCANHEIAIAWNQTGPQGPAGPAGPQGPAGPPGPTKGSAAYSIALPGCGAAGPTFSIDNGSIFGTFNSPIGTGCPGSTFKETRTWVVQNLNGPGEPVAIGSGTAVCDPCTVAGRTGSVNLALTVVGQASLDATGAPNGLQSLGGTWTVVGATGGLAGLTGQGTYSGLNPIVFMGTVVLPT